MKNDKINQATKLELDAFVYLEKKLTSLSAQIAKAADKKHQQREAREMELLEYKTEIKIQDAYGWGYITAEEREKLLSRLLEAEEKANLSSKEKIALDELNSILTKIRHTINDLEYELMSDKKKQRRREHSEEWQNKIAELRANKKVIL